MTKKTEQIQLSKLIKQITEHPHMDEIIKLMEEQILDDAD
tara:strand:+ start:370 stop:489 length:120 start_codon:yes stop_codon:yes gene_type:complete